MGSSSDGALAEFERALCYTETSQIGLPGLPGFGVSGRQQYKTGGENLCGKTYCAQENFHDN
jgi:hypothetical protein